MYPIEKKDKFYVTTAIDYVNSKPHIGTAYEKIAADSIARFHRLLGEKVKFLMGCDEHSLNVERQAKKLGKDTIKYCDEMAVEFENTWRKLFISYDDFIRTTQKRHIETVKELFKKMYEKGDIYKGKYEGYYCDSCEAFLKEGDLLDGKCKIHNIDVSWIEEDNYFFRLSAYADRLLEHINNNPDFIQPEIRRNEIVNVIKGGLEDISVSRSTMSWGINLPIDEKQVIYVWFDALINYVSGAGYSENKKEFDFFWPADLHVIGKDITRFHCIIWPAMLMSVGLELPKTVFGHGFVSIEGEKMSKTKGTVLYPIDIAEKYGSDALRYFLLREIPFDRDGDFSFEKLEKRYKADLANDLGNLLSRVVSIAEKRLEGKVEKAVNTADDIDSDLRKKWNDVLAGYVNFMRSYELEEALKILWEFIQRCNRYVEETAPWALHKENPQRFKEVIYLLLESLKRIAVLVKPFMPNTSEKMFEQLGLSNKSFLIGDLSWENSEDVFYVKKGVPLFPKLDSEK